jgi:hypothetical protein
MMRDEHRSASRHQLDHVVPTVIHNPEENMPVLARWVRHAMENQRRFWSLIAVLVVIVTGLALLSSGFSLGPSSSDAAWLRLETAKTPSERIAIAHEYPNTQPEQWALFQAALEFYHQGFAELPANRDAALASLRKALEAFDEVLRDAPQDSPQARAAAFGKGRTLEARNEIEKAIEQYQKVASTWKGTAEADQAQRLAEALRKPENVAFYKELYAYKPAEVTIPPMGEQGIPLPLGHPPLSGPGMSTSTSTSPTTPLLDLTSPLEPPPPPPMPAPRPEPPRNAENDNEKAKPASEPSLPSDVFVKPAPASEPTLPPDVFAPEKPKP